MQGESGAQPISDTDTTPGQGTHTHAHPIQVETDEIDHMGHVNNAVYLKWVQNAVIAHWERFAPVEAVREHLWVALKHEITYRRPAFLGDGIVAESIAERLVGARAFFTTLIRRGDDILAEVKSSWCCIDSITHRPVRLSQEIAQRFFAGKPAT
jgi:acyl-CoA thioester hydrolase